MLCIKNGDSVYFNRDKVILLNVEKNKRKAGRTVPGKYTVYATFEGSNSYYPSEAETFIAVDPATVTPAVEPLKTNSIADTYFIPAIAGLFVFIAIIGVAIILLQRKRP